MYATDEFTWSVGWQVSCSFFSFSSRDFSFVLDYRSLSRIILAFLNPTHLI